MASTSKFAAGFNSAVFTDAIKGAMKMGIPENPAERVIWCWHPTEPSSPSPSGSPYEWDQAPGDPDPTLPERTLVVDYALEFQQRTQANTTTLVGTFNDPTCTVTLLDEDYQLIKDADYAVIGTSIYEILFHGPVVAMFDVDVHTMFLQAHDEA